METLSKSQRNIPSKRKLFDDFQEALELNGKKFLYFIIL
jgi:hypothetical protein